MKKLIGYEETNFKLEHFGAADSHRLVTEEYYMYAMTKVCSGVFLWVVLENYENDRTPLNMQYSSEKDKRQRRSMDLFVILI